MNRQIVIILAVLSAMFTWALIPAGIYSIIQQQRTVSEYGWTVATVQIVPEMGTIDSDNARYRLLYSYIVDEKNYAIISKNYYYIDKIKYNDGDEVPIWYKKDQPQLIVTENVGDLTNSIIILIIGVIGVLPISLLTILRKKKIIR